MTRVRVVVGIGVLMLLGMAALHASGYGWVAESLRDSNAPDFLKRVLPPLFLYPSLVMCGLSAFAILATFLRAAVAPVLGGVAAVVVGHSILGFLLGGLLPGGVLLFAASWFVLGTYWAIER